MGRQRHASETVRLEDMRLFAAVADARSITGAARRLAMPKQTVSRRVAQLEMDLGVPLMHRTTRTLRLTEAGAAYAQRCREIVRIADEANRAVTEVDDEPRGTLRVTADPVFGDAFVGDLVIEYARRWPRVAIDAVMTRRRVDLIEEGFDVAFRIGQVDDGSLTGVRLGPARVRYCASPAYLSERGTPSSPVQLGDHDCVIVSDGGPVHWPFPGTKGPRLVPVTGRLTLTSFATARAAALAGLGIAIFPEFACADDIRRKRLVPVLETVEVGWVWMLHVARRPPAARVRAFLDLARAFFRDAPRVKRARSPGLTA
jgi:DNA-binding transcriptional LysR family regulator